MTAIRLPPSTHEPPPPDSRSEERHNPGTRPCDSSAPAYVLTLYVASLTPRSVIAIQSVKEVCERHLQGQYSLEVVDIYEQPSAAKREQIVAAPTLIKRLPLPLRRLIGDMADTQRVLVGLDLKARDDISNPLV